MNLFEQTINVILANHHAYSTIRSVVEKEILHYDFLRILSKAGLLQKLTFMGGACLRSCYGFPRLSEDLDFSGGFDFKKNDLRGIGELIKKGIWQKYNFAVETFEPVKKEGYTPAWKIKIVTTQERNGTEHSNLPPQRINIDICLLPSYERCPVMLKNHFGIDTGTSGLIIMAESMREILADKIISLAMRPNGVKNRDLWDIHQLKNRNIEISADLIKQKLSDRHIDFSLFQRCYNERLIQLQPQQQEFWREMQGFISPEFITGEVNDILWWGNFLSLLKECGNIV